MFGQVCPICRDVVTLLAGEVSLASRSVAGGSDVDPLDFVCLGVDAEVVVCPDPFEDCWDVPVIEESVHEVGRSVSCPQ